MSLAELELLLGVAQGKIPGEYIGVTTAWERLVHEQLVRQPAAGPWQLTERGEVFLDHVLSLPLPRQVTAWRMLGGERTRAPRMTATEVLARQPPSPSIEDEGSPPPPAPPASTLPKIEIPSDPKALEALANMLLNNGYGLNEVKEVLQLTEAQAQQFFHGG